MVDTIDPPAKIPPPILEKAGITQPAEDKEPQQEQEYHGKKREGAPHDVNQEEAETQEKQLIDILV
jgi:hypothetical protein